MLWKILSFLCTYRLEFLQSVHNRGNETNIVLKVKPWKCDKITSMKLNVKKNLKNLKINKYINK